MGLIEAKKYLAEKKHSQEVLEFEVSTATVELAAQALEVEPGMIAKTMALKLKNEDTLLIVAAGDKRMDNRKFKEAFQSKGKMLDLAEVAEMTGHPVGGVCPFGLKNELPVYLDVSLEAYEFIYPAAGSPNSAVKMRPEELQKITGGSWVDVCK